MKGDGAVKRNKFIFGLLLMATILLSGCNMRTIDQMYCLPKRPEGYMNLQSALEKAMADLSYHAPVAGDNRQPVQMKDLDGDGRDECLVFTKGSGENPLKILVFRQVGEAFVHADTLEGSGTAFEQVDYVHFTDTDSFDLVVTRQISDQGIRPLVVYSMENGKMVQISTMNYMRYLAADLNEDGLNELMILQRGENTAANGVINLLRCQNGKIVSNAVSMSVPADNVRRIQINRLQNGPSAVYLTSLVEEATLVTDVVAVQDSSLVNITLSQNSGFSESTKRDYAIYCEDIDGDGTLELPELLPSAEHSTSNQRIICWYSLNADGSRSEKIYTFHNISGGWYLKLPGEIAQKIQVTPYGNSFEFALIDEIGEHVKLMTVYAFTGQEREEYAVAENRFVLISNETTVFAGRLEVASAAYGITQEVLINAFNFVSSEQQV